MPVTLPNALTDGTTAYGSQTRANDDALAAKFTEGAGGIADADIAAAAAIKGSKISNVAGSRIPADRIEDDAVTADKLRDDATTDANRAVTTNHIRDLAVTKGKVATNTLTHSQLQMLLQATAYSVVTGGSVVQQQVAIEVSGANYVVRVVVTYVNAGNTVWTSQVVNPAPAIPTATRTPIAVYIANIGGMGTGTATGVVNVAHIAIS